MRSLKYYSEDLYVKKLKEIDFPDYSNFKDINEAYSDFTGKVASVIDEIAPIKEVRVKSNSQDWFDAEINEEIERQDKLLTKFKKSRSHSDNENYKKSRNKVQHMIKDKKKNFVIGKLNNNIGKPKELWRSLKSLRLPSKANSSATICLEKDGILSFDPKTNAEIFKDFYSNLANILVKKLPTPPNKYGKTAVNNYYKKLNLRGKNFSFAPVAPATIVKLLKQLNPAKSAGIDNLTGKFLKEGAPVLASPITDLVNLSISFTLFPDDCKIAKLKPLYKKEAKTKPKNYRPISLLPLLSKIIERILHNQTQEFLDKNNILYKYQSGFQKHHSTDTCLSYLTDKVKIGFEEGLLTGMVLIDLQKAFDTIDHSILLEKMSCLGFAGKTIAWFTSYLTNRSFIVNFFLAILNKHSPTVTLKIRGKTAPYVTSEIRKMIRQMDFLKAKANKTGSTYLWQAYQAEMRNKVGCRLQKIKKEYFTNKIEDSRGNLKNTWKILRQVTCKRNSATAIDRIKYEGNGIGDEQQISDACNHHFVSIGDKLSRNNTQTQLSAKETLRSFNALPPEPPEPLQSYLEPNDN